MPLRSNNTAPARVHVLDADDDAGPCEDIVVLAKTHSGASEDTYCGSDDDDDDRTFSLQPLVLCVFFGGPKIGCLKKKKNAGQFRGGGLENRNPARTIAHSPPGVKETLNYMLREKKTPKIIYFERPHPESPNFQNFRVFQKSKKSKNRFGSILGGFWVGSLEVNNFLFCNWGCRVSGNPHPF